MQFLSFTAICRLQESETKIAGGYVGLVKSKAAKSIPENARVFRWKSQANKSDFFVFNGSGFPSGEELNAWSLAGNWT